MVGDAAWKALTPAAQHGYLTDPTVLDRIIAMLGNPVIAMVIAMAFAIWSLDQSQDVRWVKLVHQCQKL